MWCVCGPLCLPFLHITHIIVRCHYPTKFNNVSHILFNLHMGYVSSHLNLGTSYATTREHDGRVLVRIVFFFSFFFGCFFVCVFLLAYLLWLVAVAVAVVVVVCFCKSHCVWIALFRYSPTATLPTNFRHQLRSHVKHSSRLGLSKCAVYYNIITIVVLLSNRYTRWTQRVYKNFLCLFL